MPFDPRRPAPAAPEDASEAAESEAALDAAEADALGSLVDLLLAARYTPLTVEQWRDARKSVFTYDIPVKISWEALDPRPLRRYLGVGGADKADANGDGESEGGGGGGVTAAEWGALPPFSDRVLVFVRGIGAASARGQYYSEKLDLLVSYVLLEPLASAAGAVWRALGAPLAGPLAARVPAVARLADWLQGSTPFDEYDDPETASYGGIGMRSIGGGSKSGSGSSGSSAAASADGGEGGGASAPRRPRPTALARLEAAAAAPAAAAAARRRRRAARYVTRRTLRSLLPGVVDVALALPREELLTEPTCGWLRRRGLGESGGAAPGVSSGTNLARIVLADRNIPCTRLTNPLASSQTPPTRPRRSQGGDCALPPRGAADRAGPGG
jgi:hypothetical protein